jgi:poly-gamma-glutamate synthesis protein (capsule biosynthesis protein)
VHDGRLVLALCGDVMLGRGIDQVLAHPGDPELREAWVRDARRYVELAEAVHGPVPRPVDPAWPWGEVLPVLAAAAPDAWIVNLETSVTRSDDFAPGKAVHYRMHPANLPALSVARPDVCVLANNHVLDFGRRGLAETLDVLAGAGLRCAGAGRDAAEAERPTVLPVAGGRRVLVAAVGLPSSGIPGSWAATAGRSGVAYLDELSDAAADEVLRRIDRERGARDLAVVSVHWGPNWGYGTTAEERRFAHRLVDGGVDVVHGHSSHHPREIEVHAGKLVLYGCGDLVDDYEGISGHERFRPDLRLLYLAALDAGSGRLVELRMTPLQAHRLRLRRASPDDGRWLRARLARAGHGGRWITTADDGTLVLDPTAR